MAKTKGEEKLSNAEKQRRYREKRKLNQVREAEYKEKHNERNKKRKKISDLSERQQRLQRRKWRTEYQERKSRQNSQQQDLPPSPPESIQQEPSPVESRRLQYRLRQQAVKIKELQDEMSAVKQKLARAKSTKNTYKVRLRREKTRNDAREPVTPMSKAKKQLSDSCKSRKDRLHLARKLVFHDTIVQNLKDKYAVSRKRKEKRLLSSIFLGKCIQKYRLKKIASRTMGLSSTKRMVMEEHKKQMKIKEKVESFFLREDNSRHTAGIKETKTYKGVKKQKRYLNLSMIELHKKFMKEESMKVSYPTFTRYRPFFVCALPCDSRDTCLCKYHVNMELKAKKLKELKLVESSDLATIIEQLVCDRKSEECMYGKCHVCKDKELLTPDEMPQIEITWKKWDSIIKTVERTKGKEKEVFKVKKTSKVEVKGKCSELAKEFNKEMCFFKIHVFNIKNQYRAYRELKENLNDKEVLLHIDFSENYETKYTEEIQSLHFGGSRKQVSLHTGVMYMKDKDPLPFCSISPSVDHGPQAIWAHLSPVLDYIKSKSHNIEMVHFFSDGPSTQYKQKKNFFLFSTQLFDRSFKGGTWSFFETSHGKGAPDGVGGGLKRSANQEVASGKDIPDAETLFSILQSKTSVKLFYVPQSEIDNLCKHIPDDLEAIPGTQKIHQLVASEKGSLYYRTLSCYCKENDLQKKKLCKCYPAAYKQFILQHKQGIYNIIYSDDESQSSESESQSSESESQSSESESQSSGAEPECEKSEEKTPEFKMHQPSVNNIKRSSYVLVEFEGGSNKTFRYVGICQSDYDNDTDEVSVLFMNVVGEDGTLFKVNDSDFGYIQFDQVVGVLPPPTLKLKGNRVYYKFSSPINVYERGY